MNRLLAAILLAVSLIESAAGGAADRTRGPVTTVLTVDGTACGRVTRWEGGDMRATVVRPKTAPAVKQLGPAYCAPVSFDIPFPAAKPLMELIADLCASGNKPVTLVLADVPTGASKEVSALEVRNALLTEVRFPVLGGGIKDALRLTLVFQGESSRNITVPLPGAGPAVKLAVVGALQFNVPGVDLSGITRLEPFTIKRALTSDTLGDDKSPTRLHPTPAEFPNLIGTLPGEKSSDLAAWRDQTVAGGGSAAQKKTGQLNLLDPAAKTICTLEITGLGILRLSVVPAASPAPRLMQAEFFCEGMTITAPPASAAAIIADGGPAGGAGSQQ